MISIGVLPSRDSVVMLHPSKFCSSTHLQNKSIAPFNSPLRSHSGSKPGESAAIDMNSERLGIMEDSQCLSAHEWSES